jgi:mono/diheme cytochrome c family protein
MSFKPLLASLALSTFAGMPLSDAAASEVDAAGYYKLRCATCHGVNGEGTRDKSPSLGPPLRGNPLVINAPAEMLASIIRHGRGGQQRVYDDAYPNMPAFDAGLVPDAVGLATYLKTVLQQQETASHTSAPALPDSFGGDADRERPARVVAAESVDDGDELHEAARHLAAGERQSQQRLIPQPTK